MFGCALSMKQKERSNPWQKFFTEPIESVYIVMKDGMIFKHTSRDKIKVHLNIGMLERWLRKKKYSINDIAVVIHNHLKYCSFSPNDHKQYMRLKEHRFTGQFLLYCQVTNKTYDIEDKIK